jgi:uncharacterized protein
MRVGHIGDCGAQDMDDRRRTVVENLPACRHCWARYLCGGGCFYDNLACTGDMRRPDPLFCRETKAVCEELIAGWCRLGDDEQAHACAVAAKQDLAARP